MLNNASLKVCVVELTEFYALQVWFIARNFIVKQHVDYELGLLKSRTF